MFGFRNESVKKRQFRSLSVALGEGCLLSGAFFDLFFFSLASLKNSGALLIVSRAAMPIASASISDRKYS